MEIDDEVVREWLRNWHTVLPPPFW
jgi:hypothetical protein